MSLSRTVLVNSVIVGCSLIAFIGCKKDDNNPFGPKDVSINYSPTLTEASGISYNGSYWPFEPGHRWVWSGTSEAAVAGQKSSNTVSGDMSVLPQTTISTQSGNTYKVYPVIETALNSGSSILSGESSSSAMYRYFEKTATAVMMRAIKMKDGTIIDVKNPVYIKTPLVVGDSWESEPTFDINAMMKAMGESANVAMKIASKTFVVGKEMKMVLGEMVETVKLEQIAKVSCTISDRGSSASLAMDMFIILNLKKDVGIVYQDLDLDMKIFDGKESLDIGISMQLSLDSYNFGSGISSTSSSSGMMKRGVEVNNTVFQKVDSLKIDTAIKSLIKSALIVCK